MEQMETPETHPHLTSPVPSKEWDEVERLIDLECRRLKKARAFPRLAIGTMLWIDISIVPEKPRSKRRLELMLRRGFVKHQIVLCHQGVHIGLFGKGELKHGPVEIVVQWAVPVPVRDLEELAQAARDLAVRSANFAEKVDGAAESKSR